MARLARLTKIAEEIENVCVMETVERFALKTVSVYDCVRLQDFVRTFLENKRKILNQRYVDVSCFLALL